MAVPVTLPAQNPKRTLWNVTAFLICVSIMAFIRFQRTFHSPIPWVSALTLGVSIMVIHTRSVGIFPVSHMNWTNSTSFINLAGLGGGGCLLRRVCPPQPRQEVLVLQVRVAPCPIPPQPEYCLLHLCLCLESIVDFNGSMWVGTVLPGGDGSYH